MQVNQACTSTSYFLENTSWEKYLPQIHIKRAFVVKDNTYILVIKHVLSKFKLVECRDQACRKKPTKGQK